MFAEGPQEVLEIGSGGLVDDLLKYRGCSPFPELAIQW